MEEVKENLGNLIEKIWWVIPPVFIIFVYWPLVGYWGAFGSLSFEGYIRVLKPLIIDKPLPIFFWSFFLFGFMGVGFLLTRRRSLILRVIVPIILAILGSFIAIFVAMTMSTSV